MTILNSYPHIKNRIVSIDDDEKLALTIKYGCEIVILDIDTEEFDVGELHHTGYPIFKFIESDSSLQSNTNDKYDNLILYPMDYGKIVRTANRFFILKDAFNYDFLDFNDFWKLRPKDNDDEIMNIFINDYEHIFSKVVDITYERHAEIAKTVGYNFLILNIDLPKYIPHMKVHEGCVFSLEYQDSDIGHPNERRLHLVSPKTENKERTILSNEGYGNVWIKNPDGIYHTYGYRKKDFSGISEKEFKSFWS